MKKLLLNRWFLGTVGVVLLALVLWFLGPYFAFGETRPLFSVLGRVIAVLVLGIVWIAILQWQYFRAVRGSQKLAADVAGQAEAPAVARAFVPAAFDSEGFTRIAKMIFIRLQAANDEANLDDLRKFTTPELFASLRLELQERGNAAQPTCKAAGNRTGKGENVSFTMISPDQRKPNQPG